MKRDLAETVARMGQVLTAGGEEKRSGSGQGTFCTAVSCLGCRGTDGKSGGGALTARPMFKAAGREGLGSLA